MREREREMRVGKRRNTLVFGALFATPAVAVAFFGINILSFFFIISLQKYFHCSLHHNSSVVRFALSLSLKLYWMCNQTQKKGLVKRRVPLTRTYFFL